MRKMEGRWPTQATETLIEQIQKFEYLYNLHSPHYIDKAKKSAAYECLVNELKKHIKNVTADDIKKKIHCLRSQYRRELRCFEESEKSGHDVYTPRLWCFDMLDFLRPYCRKRPASLNTKEDNADCSDDGSCASKECNSQKKMKHDPEASLGLRLNTIQELVAKRMDLPKHEYKWLGDQVVFEMKNIRSTTIKRQTARAIQNVLNEALDEDMTASEPSTSRYTNLYTRK